MKTIPLTILPKPAGDIRLQCVFDAEEFSPKTEFLDGLSGWFALSSYKTLTPESFLHFAEMADSVAADLLGDGSKSRLNDVQVLFTHLLSLDANYRDKVTELAQLYHRDTVYDHRAYHVDRNPSDFLLTYALQRFLAPDVTQAAQSVRISILGTLILQFWFSSINQSLAVMAYPAVERGLDSLDSRITRVLSLPDPLEGVLIGMREGGYRQEGLVSSPGYIDVADNPDFTEKAAGVYSFRVSDNGTLKGVLRRVGVDNGHLDRVTTLCFMLLSRSPWEFQYMFSFFGNRARYFTSLTGSQLTTLGVSLTRIAQRDFDLFQAVHFYSGNLGVVKHCLRNQNSHWIDFADKEVRKDRSDYVRTVKLVLGSNFAISASTLPTYATLRSGITPETLPILLSDKERRLGFIIFDRSFVTALKTKKGGRTIAGPVRVISYDCAHLLQDDKNAQAFAALTSRGGDLIGTLLKVGMVKDGKDSTGVQHAVDTLEHAHVHPTQIRNLAGVTRRRPELKLDSTESSVGAALATPGSSRYLLGDPVAGAPASRVDLTPGGIDKFCLHDFY